MVRLRGAALLLMLPACVPAPDPRLIGPPEIAPPPGEQDSCGAASLALWTGLPGRALKDRVPADRLRLIPPGTGTTRDFRPDRLNAELDAEGRILRLYCG